MPRKAREKSESGIYHVMLRGANRQEIFHDDEDNFRFLETIGKYKNQVELKVYGWCLMGNHIHLLLGEGIEEFSVTMKRIGVSFVRYYNNKYSTIGHLFQDRFLSERVESDSYLMTVIRYIHQNPVKAGLVKKPADWTFSSCREYYGSNAYPVGLLDKELILGMLVDDTVKRVERFKDFNEAENEDICMGKEKIRKLTDDEARVEIEKLVSTIEMLQIKIIPKPQRNEILLKIMQINGLTQRQAARILGISPNLIFKL